MNVLAQKLKNGLWSDNSMECPKAVHIQIMYVFPIKTSAFEITNRC